MNQFQNNIGAVDASFSTEATRKFLLNVYNWMAMGLALTGVVAYGIANSSFVNVIMSNPIIYFGLFIAQLGVVMGLTFAINKIPSGVAIGAFFLYAALTGLTFSVLFLVYTGGSIASTFFICASMFLGISIFGYVTKMDLSKFGTYLFMALIGIIVASVVNIFLKSNTLNWIISYVVIKSDPSSYNEPFSGSRAPVIDRGFFFHDTFYSCQKITLVNTRVACAFNNCIFIIHNYHVTTPYD